MSRRLAREMALQVMFYLDFNNTETKQAIEKVFNEHTSAKEAAKVYAVRLIEGTVDNVEAIDSIISKYANEWTIERMAGIDRNIIRIALFEMKFGSEKMTPNVVINEAVELAKKYGTEESGRFVNGVLGSIVKHGELM